MTFLEIKNLSVSADGKEILKGINLDFEKGKIYALMGPNGSGKSTLSRVVAGDPKYKISEGKIIFENEEITNLSPDERAKKGIFITFQNPVEIEGVSVSKLIRTSGIEKKKESLLEFQRNLNEKARELNLNPELLSRDLNKNFSGGEKKKSEVIQLLSLNPKFIILDEIDSGLDVDSIKVIAEKINRFMSKEKTIIIITHYRRILDYISPDKVFVFSKGEVSKEGGEELIKEIDEKGFND